MFAFFAKHRIEVGDHPFQNDTGVYELRLDGTRLRFQSVRAPTSAELTQLAHTIARRVGRLLEREGLLERDTAQLDLGQALDTDDPMPDLVGHSITYRVAVAPHRGRKVFKLQTLPDSGWEQQPDDAPGNVGGFSLHAGVAVKSNQREKLERLCRYNCRPPLSEKRFFITPRGDIGYSLNTPYRNGTTHVIFEPLDFIARLAALVPPPRRNLTRFRRVRTQQPVPRPDYAGSPGPRCQAGQASASRAAHARRATGRDALGAKAQAGFQDGRRNLPELRRRG